MALYSLTQFVSVLLLYTVSASWARGGGRGAGRFRNSHSGRRACPGPGAWAPWVSEARIV